SRSHRHLRAAADRRSAAPTDPRACTGACAAGRSPRTWHGEPAARRRALGAGRHDITCRARARDARSLTPDAAGRMPGFHYEAVDATGKVRRGQLDADTPRAARERLRGDGLFPTEILESELAAAAVERLRLPP